MSINKQLAKERNLSLKAIYEIERLHSKRALIFEEMGKITDLNILKSYDAQLDELEYDLQNLWGFPTESRFIKFWYRPKCTCPKIDNEERYGTGYTIISEDCPLHGNKATK